MEGIQIQRTIGRVHAAPEAIRQRSLRRQRQYPTQTRRNLRRHIVLIEVGITVLAVPKLTRVLRRSRKYTRLIFANVVRNSAGVAAA